MKFIFDFDYTLFNTQSMRDSMLHVLEDAFGVSESAYYEAEARITEEGRLYTIDAHVYELLNDEEDREKALALIDEMMNHADSFLYGDVLLELQTLSQHQHDLNILSFGNVDWQMYKISRTQLPQLVKHIEVVDTKKTEAIDMFTGDDIICVNDRASEINDMAAAFPHVTYVWISREGDPYANEAPTVQHIRVSQISDISL